MPLSKLVAPQLRFLTSSDAAMGAAKSVKEQKVRTSLTKRRNSVALAPVILRSREQRVYQLQTSLSTPRPSILRQALSSKTNPTLIATVRVQLHSVSVLRIALQLVHNLAARRRLEKS